MKVNSVTNNQSFEGKVILKNKISTQQNYLFNLHKPALDKKIKDMPFDLYVEQSKSKKTITLSTNVKDANAYIVRKNKQNFEEVADLVIADAKKKSDAYIKQQKINEMFNHEKSVWFNIITGNFKEARNSEKQLAKLAVKDFETYTSIPKVEVTNLPLDVGKHIMGKSLKYRIYRAFSPKTEEEKKFLEMKKEYYKKLKAEKKEIKTVRIEFPQFY